MPKGGDGETGFAPQAPKDNREISDWESRYNKDAKKEIRLENFILILFFLFSLLMIILTWLEIPKELLNLTKPQYSYIKIFIYSMSGGLFGGTLFSIKWLYHTVAKGIWNIDRRLWRFMTPLISTGLSLVFIIFIKSGLFSVFNTESILSGTLSFSIGFLVGYFSDSAIAKMADIAKTLFGVSPEN